MACNNSSGSNCLLWTCLTCRMCRMSGRGWSHPLNVGAQLPGPAPNRRPSGQADFTPLVAIEQTGTFLERHNPPPHEGFCTSGKPRTVLSTAVLESAGFG